MVKKAQAEIDVVMGADGKAVMTTLDRIVKRMEEMQRITDAIAKAAKKAGDAFNFQPNAKKFDDVLRKFEAMEKRMQSLARAPITQANNDRTFAGQVRSATNFNRPLKDAQNDAQALSARLVAIDKQLIELGNKGKTGSKSLMSKQLGLEQAQTDLKKLQREIEATNKLADRANRSGVSGLTGGTRVDAAQAAFSAAVNNPRRSNFDKELKEMRESTRAYQQEIAVARKARADFLAEERRNTAAGRRSDNKFNDNNYADQSRRHIASLKDRAALESGLNQIKARQVDLAQRYTAASDAAKPRLLEQINLERGVRSQIEGRIAAIDRASAAERKAADRAAQAQRNADQRVGDTADRGFRRVTTVDRNREEVAALNSKVALEQRLNQVKAEQARLAQQYMGSTNRQKQGVLDLINTERMHRAEIEKALKAIEAKARAAQRAADAEARRNAGGGSGGGIFGSGGISAVFLRTGAYGAAAAAIYGVVGAMKDAIDFTIKFEDQMTKISAIAGLTATQTDKLGNTILQVGTTSRYATQDIAEATTVLAQAGFTAEDIKGSLAAVGNLASASGVTFAEATDVITAAIGSFQLQASEAGRITDVLASALNNTKLNIQQVALGIQYAGATANEMGISFEELTAVMATMAQAGIRSGSTIGTGLRQFLVDLQTPSKKLTEALTGLGLSMSDINIRTLGLPEVLERLANAGFDSATAYTALETRAAAAYIVLRANRDEINKQIIAQNQVGLAAEAAARGQDSLSAQWQRFKNILNDTTNEGIRPMERGLKDMFNRFNEISSNEGLKKLNDEFRELSRTGEGGVKALALKRQEIYDYADALVTLISMENDWREQLEASTTAVNETTDAVAQQKTTMDTLDTAIQRVIIRKASLKDGSTALGAEIAQLMNKFAGLARYLDGTSMSYDNLTNALRRYRMEQQRELGVRLNANVAALDTNLLQRQGQSEQAMAKMKSSGLWAAMPKGMRALFERAQANPGDQTVQARLRDAVEKSNMNGVQKRLATNAYSSIAGVGRTQDLRNKQVFERDVQTALGQKTGTELSNRLNFDLPNKSDAEKKAFAADMIKKSQTPGLAPAAREAYMRLATEASGLIGMGNDPVGVNPKDKPERKPRGGADKAEREEDRRQKALMQARLKATEAELALSIKKLADEGGSDGALASDGAIEVGGRKSLTKGMVLANLKKADEKLEKWVTDRTSLMEAEIDSNNMTGETAELFRAEIAREIDAMREKTKGEITEGLITAMDAMLDAVNKIKEKAESAADQALAMSEARLTALDRSNMKGRVPDYVKNFYARRVDKDKDKRDQAQIGINETAVTGLKDKRDWWQDVFTQANAEKNVVGMAITRKAMEELDTQILTLTRNTEVMRASFRGEELLPQSFSQSLQMAIEDFREANGMNLSFQESLANELPGVLSGASAATSSFFTDILTGTATVKQAFGSFVKSMIQMLQQLIAKFIAMQAFKFLLSAFGGGGPNMSAITPIGADGVDPLAALFNGGEVKGAFRGEHIQTGVPGRDSTLRKLAKGEYVVRKAAVDSVGVGFMKNLNERGAHAVKPAPIVMPTPAQQEMSVFVVKPDTKPQMGPRDVLVTIHDDILRDGQTRKLIKHIAQGG